MSAHGGRVFVCTSTDGDGQCSAGPDGCGYCRAECRWPLADSDQSAAVDTYETQESSDGR